MSVAQDEPGETANQPQRPGSVLFVCGKNCIRSPIAEHLTKKLYRGVIFADSAGASTGDSDPFVLEVMSELGIDLSKHRAKTLEDLEDDYFDLIVTLAPEAHHKALEFTRGSSVEVEYWPTMDPSGIAGNREQILDAYREVRNRLEKRIRERFGS